MVLCCNTHATGSFDTEDDNNGPQDDDVHGEPDFEVQKITTDMQNMLAQKQINRFFTLDYFSGPADEQNEAKNLENEANEKAADEELMKQAQQYSGILNAEDIGEDGKIVREYFNDINTLIKSVLGTISFAKCPREKQQSMLEKIKKNIEMFENIEDSARENGVSVNEILQESIQLFFGFCEETPFRVSRKRYSESIKCQVSGVKRLMRDVNEEVMPEY